MQANPGDVLSHLEMSQIEGVHLQKGMNYRLKGGTSVFLMSMRPGAPYADRVEEDGHILIYEGHDTPRRPGQDDPKAIDQPMYTYGGKLTENGLFYEAAALYKAGTRSAERIKVYEKIRNGIWVYNGLFDLVDAWIESAGDRNVFKFKLHLLEEAPEEYYQPQDIDHTRIIPTSVKLEVWKRDQGRCRECASADNLHFDHIIPYSKGGSSLTAENIQLLCARHNLQKRDQIK